MHAMAPHGGGHEQILKFGLELFYNAMRRLPLLNGRDADYRVYICA